MPDYATQPTGSRSAPDASPGGGIDAKTLFLTACASAAAAYASSKLWAPGTLAAAAFTPVLVAILKEALAKPADVVARAVPVRGVVRSARAQGPEPVERRATRVGQPGDGPATRVAQPGEVHYHGGGRRMRGWRLAVVTGLLGFLVCAVVFTVPELVAGGSAAGGGRDTTIFGGGSGTERDRPEPGVTTPARTVTTPPATTVTVPAPAITTTPRTTPTPAPPVNETAPVPTPDPAAPTVVEPPAAQPPG